MTEEFDWDLANAILELHRQAEKRGLPDTAGYLRDAFFASFYERVPIEEERQDDGIFAAHALFRSRMNAH